MISVLPFYSLIQAGEDCKPSSHCICFDDPNYYSQKECYSNNKPWGGYHNRPIEPLPDSPTEDEILFKFYPYSKNFDLKNFNINKFENLRMNVPTPQNFDFTRETKILVHGFISSASETGWQINMLKKFIESNYQFNIIVVDWSAGANVGVFNLDYPKAVQNTRVVGDALAQLIYKNILQQNPEYLAQNNLHCIGHSLGSHICGYVGKNLKKYSQNQQILKRISGLDPAGPYFENLDAIVRLDKNDAIFVDSIHTDGKPLYQAGFGMLQDISDVDFYPNGGYSQPGCHQLHIGCSHGRSCEIYIDSILPENQEYACLGKPCESETDFWSSTCQKCAEHGCPEMGWFSDRNPNFGKFYLHTGENQPYCLVLSELS